MYLVGPQIKNPDGKGQQWSLKHTQQFLVINLVFSLVSLYPAWNCKWRKSCLLQCMGRGGLCGERRTVISMAIPVLWQGPSYLQPPAEQNCASLAVALHICASNAAQTPQKGPRMEDSGWMMNVTHLGIHYSPKVMQLPEGTASFTDTTCPTSVTLMAPQTK